jgi:NADH dehydrogenase
MAAAVLIDGATGYVGSHLANRLQKDGLSVHCLVRSAANPHDVDILKSCTSEIICADLNSSNNQLIEAFRKIDIAIHLIGSIAPKRQESLTTLHVDLTRHFAELCLKAGVKKVIMVTALGASDEAASNYLRTKWQAEEILRASGLNCIFLRPSLLVGRSFGKRDSKLISRLRKLIETKAIIPLIGGGRNRIQPLFIDDLVEAISRCCHSQEANCGNLAPVFELGGASILSMKELIEELMQVLDVKKPLVDLPIFLASPIAALAEALQEVPIFSRDQLKLSMGDNVCKYNALEEKLGIRPTSLRNALESYMRNERAECLR